jgi:hypothetical protein
MFNFRDRKFRQASPMTFRKISISVSLLFLLSVSVFGQQENVAQKKNALKLNSAALAFSNASMLYERSLNKHWSVLAAAGYKWGNNVPKVLGLGNLIVESPTGGLRAYSFTPEARYYFNVCECKGSPSGFYAGLYYRMSNYYGELSFQYWNGAEYLF